MNIMNKLKNMLIRAFALVVMFGMSACESFLEEDKFWKMTTQYFDTPEGLRELATGLPNVFRTNFSSEFGYAIGGNYGTDEFQVGSDGANRPWNDYNAVLQASMWGTNLALPQTSWNNAYVAINNCNTVIAKAPTVLAGEADLNTVLGEACFTRGWVYFYLVQLWGGVPLKLEPSESLEREFTRASTQETIQRVIDDFTEAYAKLSNPAERVPGKIYRDAAAHYLAKALLWRQSEICSDFGASTKADDLAKALQLCDEVIANRQLAPDFADLWSYTGFDGPNETLDEVLLSAQYTDWSTKTHGSYGNRMHMYCLSVYGNWAGMTRNTAGGREFHRMKTTNYSYDVFDRVNDSRFWKSFRTKMLINLPAKAKPAGWIKDGDVALAMGQLGVMHIINNPDDAERFSVIPGITDGQSSDYVPTHAVQPRQILMKNTQTGRYEPILDPETGNCVPTVLPRYRVVEGYPDISTYAFGAVGIWASLSKYVDGLRENFNQEIGTRDGINARLGETYLMAAEIKVRQGDYAGAITQYINPLRRRAAYKAGEDRSKYVDGGQSYTPTGNEPATTFCPENSYYESNNIPVTTAATTLDISGPDNLPAEDMAIIQKLGLSSDFDKMLCFVLNERSRELMGEMLRWTDLSRTKTLLKRAYAYNEDVAAEGNLQDYHLLRPIPQTFLDDNWKDGRPLTADEKKAMQNPGYN
jgi:hypothetical protein